MIFLKSILENKLSIEGKLILIGKLFVGEHFYKICCAIIFLSSIFIRSLMDIGPDTSVYLDVGKKIALGKKYYFDIFEINFPILMWLYALEYKISQFLNISPIITCEIVVNILALSSILFSAQRLKKTAIYQDKNLYKIIIVSFFLSFFLRPYSMHLLEFGTKTSYFLILFYPYFALSQNFLNTSSKLELIIKGTLMALIACLKPHYLIFILIIESYFILKQKKLTAIFNLDRLVAVAIYLLYIVAILKFAPEFFDDVAPMWSSYFKTYHNFDKLITNLYSNTAFVIFPYLAILLIFTRVKFTEIDKLFLVIFVASAIVVLLENIFTIDQFSLFCAINLPFMMRVLQIIQRNNFLKFSDNLFFLGFFIIIPFSQTEFIRISIFGYSGAFNLWWGMLIYNIVILYRKIDLIERKKIFSKKNYAIFLALYLSCFALTIYGFKGANFWLSNFINLISFLLFYFFAEKYFFYKAYQQLTRFSIFVVMASMFLYLHDYGDSLKNLTAEDGFRNKFRKIYDFKAYYYKKYAPKQGDHELDFYSFHQLAHPLSSYFKKDMPQKMSIFNMNANNSHAKMLFNNKDSQSNFVDGYIINDLKKMLRDKNTKLIFIDYQKINEKETNKCIIGYLEYLFLDVEIKELFLKNFSFENRLIDAKNTDSAVGDFGNILTKSSNDYVDEISQKFNQIIAQKYAGKNQKIITDIEIYVRKN